MFFMASPSSSASSSPSSTSSSPIHHASLVDPANHNPALLELIDVKVSKQVIEYTVDRVVETVDFAMGRPTPSSSRGRSGTRRPEHAKFTTFVTTVLTRAEVTMPTLLATFVYIDRARPHLHIGLEQWALERVFLGALIVASKYLNDSTLKNVHWALCTGVFGKRDVGRIEREYLDVLNFELSLSEDDLLVHHGGLSEVITHLSHSPPSVVVQETKEVSPPTFPTQPTYHHTERRHSHRRTSTAASHKVPELSPSSVSSTDSDASVSPRTPSDPMVISPPATGKKSLHFLQPHSQSKHLLPPSTSHVSKSRSILDLFPSIPKSSRLTT